MYNGFAVGDDPADIEAKFEADWVAMLAIISDVSPCLDDITVEKRDKDDDDDDIYHSFLCPAGKWCKTTIY